MSSIVSALRAVKSAAPKIVRRPLHAPSILRSHLSAQTAGVLADFFDLKNDSGGPGPEFSRAYPAPAPPSPPARPTPAGALGGGAPSRRGTVGEDSLGLGDLQFDGGSSGAGSFRGSGQNIMIGSMRASQMVSSLGLGGGGGSLPGSRRGSIDYVSDLGLGGDEGGSSNVFRGSTNGLQTQGGAVYNTLPVLPQFEESDEDNDVKYVRSTLYRLQRYYVSIDKVLIRRGIAFDTYAVKKTFTDKVHDDDRDIGIAGLGFSPRDRQFKHIEDEWLNTSLIWVCVKESEFDEPTFYSHVGQPHRFHHSSFTAGGKVIAAGEWIVRDGALLKINCNSGHYRPPLSALQRAALFLKKAWRSDTKVVLFNTQTKQYEEVRIEAFSYEGSRGGLYKPVASAA